jgi:DNA mismatch endonuclease (patch repair protein)
MTRSQQMARIRSSDTKPELRLRRHLWAAGLRYRLRPALPGTPDIAFISARVAVFVDGCFWHGCPSHYQRPVRNADFWSAKLARNANRDRMVDRKLQELGWTVHRIWEHDLRSDLGEVGALVVSLVRNGPQRATTTLCVGRTPSVDYSRGAVLRPSLCTSRRRRRSSLGLS